MPDVTIRPATTPADIEAVATLFRAYAASLDTDLAYQGFATELATLPGAYAPPNGALLLARDPAQTPIGCVALRRITETRCEMKRLYVAPPGRGQGLGAALVTQLVVEAKRLNYQELVLDTLPSMHQAQSLYAQAGFHPIPAYYPSPIEGTAFLAKTLT